MLDSKQHPGVWLSFAIQQSAMAHSNESNEDFDNSTSFLGDYGFFQISMMVLLSLSIVPSGNMDMISVFMYHCKASLNSTLNSSRIGPDSCSRNKVTVNWTETAGQSNDTEPCLDGWVFSTEMYTATIVSEVYLHLATS